MSKKLALGYGTCLIEGRLIPVTEATVQPCDDPGCAPCQTARLEVAKSGPGNQSAMLHVKQSEAEVIEQTRARILELQGEIDQRKHVAWARMQFIRERATKEQGREMDDLHDFARGRQAEIDALTSVLIEHKQSQPLDHLLVHAGPPALMVF